ncbi:Cof-type HAD-IIB family hydrolase [Paenibacillus sp. y28]|uniref:Cof-type HAD-IIB family hydrolase n=1 Tax=Paenibacillus sp. y28 TaxID=3129110 RepID=UPI00301A9736
MTKSRSMIFLDIDGTLLDHHKQLPASAKEAVQQLKQAGHEVAFATGRSPFMLKPLREELGLESFVSFNGQYVSHQGKVIYTNPLRTDLLQALTDYAGRHGSPLVYMDHEAMKSSAAHHPYIEESIGSLQFSHPEHDPRYYADRSIYQSMLFCTEAEEVRYRADFPELDFVRWHPYSMDVLPSGGSKAQGIAQYIAKLGFAREDVYAFGDNLNDVEMLQFVGHGVAMGNAPDSVKQLARYVTKDVSEDGLAYGLKMVGLL